jgi:hypothetical protein
VEHGQAPQVTVEMQTVHWHTHVPPPPQVVVKQLTPGVVPPWHVQVDR